MDEIFEAAALIQNGKIQGFPLVLMCREFWRPLLDFVENGLLRAATIDPIDAARLSVTDSPAEAVASVTDLAMRRFGLTYGPRVKRR